MKKKTRRKKIVIIDILSSVFINLFYLLILNLIFNLSGSHGGGDGNMIWVVLLGVLISQILLSLIVLISYDIGSENSSLPVRLVSFTLLNLLFPITVFYFSMFPVLNGLSEVACIIIAPIFFSVIYYYINWKYLNFS